MGVNESGTAPVADPAELARLLDGADYLVDDGLAMALFLGLVLGQPVLLEGEPGVGKTSAAKALAQALGGPLIRLQCYEGLTASQALYEWDYARQLLAIRAAESRGQDLADGDLFSERFLRERPILRAVRHTGPAPAVLLVDEIDRADDEFDALLLEFLGEGSVTVPEIGTFSAARPPVVVLTSNRSRELHDALRRRCLYHWLEYPDPARAAAILRRRVPGARTALLAATADFVLRARRLELDKAPGLAEAIDWVAALAALGVSELTPDRGLATLAALAKTVDDRQVLAAALGGGPGPGG